MRKLSSLYQKLDQVDPLQLLASTLFKGRPLLTAILIGVIQVATWWFFGNYITAHFSAPMNLPFLGPRDVGEYAWAFFLWGVFSPVIAWYYLTSPRLWSSLVKNLCDENVVDCESFQSCINPRIARTLFPITLLIAAGVVYFYINFSIPAEIENGRYTFWSITPHGVPILGLFVGFNTYVLVNFALRTLGMIMAIHQYFNRNGIKAIHIHHIDQCGGFAPIGFLAMRLASLAVVVGLWATWYALLPVIAGGDLNMSTTVILLYLAYIILVPLLLISLTRPVSQAMKRYKQDFIKKFSKRLEAELDLVVEGEITPGKTKGAVNLLKRVEEYQRLNSFYEHLNSMPESPFRAMNLKRFTGLASLPAVVGFVSFFADVFAVFTWFKE